MGTVDPEELGELRAGEEQGDTTLEAHHHAFGDEVDDRPRPSQPGNERNQRHEQGGSRGQGGEPAGVAASHLAERSAEQERDGRGYRDGSMSRTAEKPE